MREARILVGGTAISYAVRRSARATRLRLTVRPGRVEVVAPMHVDDALIVGFVESKRRWLYAKTEALRERSLGALPRRFENGARVLFRGRLLELRVEPADVRRATLRFAGAFHVRVPRRLGEDERERRVRARVLAWLRDRARSAAAELVRRHAPALGAAPTALRIGNQKTVWGSCSARGTISLNLRLMAAPEPVFEYVVVHELCHLVERNHGPRFWALVGRLLPDYRERRAWLKKHGVALG